MLIGTVYLLSILLKRYTNVNSEICQYIRLHIRKTCRGFHIITTFSFLQGSKLANFSSTVFLMHH